jgi:hypothetical protein
MPRYRLHETYMYALTSGFPHNNNTSLTLEIEERLTAYGSYAVKASTTYIGSR